MHNFIRLRAFLVVMSLILSAFSATTAHASVSQTVSYSQGIENTYPFTIPAGLSVSISLSISITGTVTITDPDGDVVATIGVSGPNSTPSTSEVTLSKAGTYNVSESFDAILTATPPALYGQPETITDSGTDEWSFVNPAPGNSGTFEVSSGISMSVETEGNISVGLSETSATITVTGAGIAPGESASADVTGEWSVSTSMDVHVPPETGTINVTTNLEAPFEITGAAKYSGTGPSWTTTNAPVGDYSITFGEVEGYYTPESKSDTLEADKTISFDGTYVEIPTGTINVTTNLHAATFSIAGPKNYTGGGMESTISAPVGSYSITFGAVDGYYTPESKSDTLEADKTISFDGTYVEIPTGTINVTTNLHAATFSIAGPKNYTGGGMESTISAPVGDYSITFGEVEGYYTPGLQRATLDEGREINFTGTYVEIPTGAINVTTNRDAATFDLTGYAFLFSVGLEYQTNLDSENISAGLRQEFANSGFALSQSATVLVQMEGSEWRIDDWDNEKTYVIRKEGGKLNVYSVVNYSGSGRAWTKLNAHVGEYTIAYGDVSGYFTPEPQTATLNDGEVINFEGVYIARPIGNINVTTNMDAATFDIAGPDNYSGSGKAWTKEGAYVGEYTITYGAIAGYATPSSQTAVLEPAGEINFEGIYVEIPIGTINVNTNLDVATFDIFGTAELIGTVEYSGSGKIWINPNAPAGDYTITYGVVDGYITPEQQAATLVAGGEIDFVGIYVEIPTGTIDVTTNLDAATFDITGPANYNGAGKKWTKISAPLGEYTIVYNDVSGYITPGSQTAILNEDGVINFTGTYRATGTIEVTTNLEAATFVLTGPAEYEGHGKLWTQVGAVIGRYTITYGDVFGYITPPSETKTLVMGGKITFDGTYVDLTPPTISSVEVSGSPARKVGDIITVTLRGEPAGIAYFDIAGIAADVPMPEDPNAPGTYIGYYTAVAGKNVRDAMVTVHLTDAAGNSSVNNDKTASVITAPWDVNSDGSVDVLDANAVGSNMGGNPVPSPGLYVDVNDDGEVNFLDLVLVGLHFGEKYGENGGILAPARPLSQEAIAPFATSYQLLQNYPNPLNPDTWIPYISPQGGEVTISIYSLTGKLVRRLELGYRIQGFYVTKDRAAYWDGKNDMGEAVASGMYFYHIKSGNFSSVRKMLVSK